MPLTPLATAADMLAFGYTPVDDEWLVRASTRIRTAIKQDITPGTSIAKLSGFGPWILPQRPVTAVLSVEDVGGNPVDFELRSQTIHISQFGYRFPYPGSRPLPIVFVEYSHGFDPVPDGLVELTCSIASRIANMPEQVAMGARTEQAGGEAVTWGVEAFNSAAGLTAGELKILRTFYPKYSTAVRII